MVKLGIVHNVSLWAWHNNHEEGGVIENSWIVFDPRTGTIESVGDGNGSPGEFSGFDPVIDGEGKLAIPGLIDAHLHVAGLGESYTFLNCSSSRSIQELQFLIEQHVMKHTADELPWLVGVSWDQTDLGRFPTRQDIDAVCSDRPVFLWRACWHVGVANTVALIAAGVLSSTPANVQGGEVEVDAATGLPTGLLKERAVELVTSIMSKGRTVEQKKGFITTGLASCISRGLTAVQTNDEGCLEAYMALQLTGKLAPRIFLTPTFDDFASGDELYSHPLIPGCYKEGDDLSDSSFADESSKLIVNRLKIFSDGSLGAATAALRPDPPQKGTTDDGLQKVAEDDTGGEGTGMLIHSQEALTEMVQRARAAGFRLEIHAIGDRAAQCVLSALELGGSTPAERPVLTHCQVLGKDLIARMAKGGVVANVQPSFVPTDMRWVQERLSPSRQRFSYAWRSLMAASVIVAGGSDAPIETPDPFTGIYDAIFRESRESPVKGEPGAPADPSQQFLPNEALTFAQALWIYTIGAAWAAGPGVERRLGKLEPGYCADIVLVDREVVNDPRLLLGARPFIVMVGGRIEWKDDGDGVGSTYAMRGDFVPGKAGCPCCRPGPKRAGRSRAFVDEDESSVSGLENSEEVFCQLSAPGQRRRVARTSQRHPRKR